MDIKNLSVILGIITTISGATYFAATTFAKESDLQIASTKAEMALSINIDSMQAKLVLLEIKPNKTPYDLAKIKFLQDEIKRLRKLRSL